MPDRMFYRDRAGRSFKGGGRRTSAQDRESRRELEEGRFAKQMAERLNEGFRDHESERLAIVASPKALGHVREHLNSRVKKGVVGSSSKNLTQANREAIKQHLDLTIG